MRKSTEYAIVAVFVILYVSVFIIAYHFLKDDEASFYFAMTMISMMIMGVTMVLSVIFLQSNRNDEIREHYEQRQKTKEDDKP